MSTLIVDVCDIKAVEPHSNADKLEMIVVKGWRVAVQKSLNLKVGDKVVYFPPDCVMSDELAEKLGITKYLSPLRKNDDGSRPPGLRVRAARLRGEASYGTIDHEVDPNWEVGKNVAEILGITKWEPPPPRATDGDAAPAHSAFHKYTEIENIRNYPDIFEEGEEVVMDEKMHGKNVRNGRIWIASEDGSKTAVFMGGSHAVNRKPEDAKGRQSDFWKPLDNQNLKDLILHLAGDSHNVIVFSELLNTQKGFLYGMGNGEIGFRVFDIAVDMKYLDKTTTVELCEKFGIPMAPVLYRGPFSWSKMEELTYGDTTVCPLEKAGKFKGREGIIVRPVKERYDMRLPGSGRVILKSISADYLDYRDKKGAEEMDAADN